jgi:hypothetical protein
MVSNENVENVVNPPNTPNPKNCFNPEESGSGIIETVTPIKKDPKTLTRSVETGKEEE